MATISSRSGEDLVTRTPCCWTCCGSREMAVWMAFWTWTWAMSGSMLFSRMTLMLTWPRAVEDDWKYRRPSIPVSCCSRIWVTLPSSVAAEAPGKVARMLIWVGATSGYWATGRDMIAPMPISMMMIAITQAKIGRSMKIRDIGGLAAPPLGVHFLELLGRRRLDALGGAGRDRLDRCAVLEVGGALGDHFLAAGEALGHDPILPLHAVGDDDPLDHAVAGADHEQRRIALGIAGDRRLRHEEGAGVDRLGEARGDEHARQKHRLRVGEAGAEGHRARRLVDQHLAELDRAAEPIFAAVGELEADLGGGRDRAPLA